jgi:hypothetical protein
LVLFLEAALSFYLYLDWQGRRSGNNDHWMGRAEEWIF